jgi:hypothetical protein
MLVYLLVSALPFDMDTNMPFTDATARNAKRSATMRKLSDGGGLHLLVQPTGSKLWRMAYRFAGKQKTLALGLYPAVSLAEARNGRDQAKKLPLRQRRLLLHQPPCSFPH